MNFSGTVCCSGAILAPEDNSSRHLPSSLCEVPDQTFTIASGDRADGGQEILHEMTDYQPNARVEVCVEDVSQVEVGGVEDLSVTP